MPIKSKAVLILGSRDHDNEIAFVQSLGHAALLFSAKISLEDALAVDVPVEIDLNEEERVVAKALALGRQFDIVAVYTLVEYRVPLAARVAAALGLHSGLPWEAALNCRNKTRTRQILAQHQLGSAKFVIVRTPQEALEALAGFSLPVIVKPSNDAGSNQVMCCTTSQEVEAAVTAIRQRTTNWVGQPLDAEVLLEEFLEGPEVSVEAATAAGQTTVLAITAKQTTPLPLAVEVGHVVPAPLTREQVVEIEQLVIAALAALGVTDTVTHTEVKLTPRGPRLIEVNARPGGDKIPQLVRAVTGYDLREVALYLALGKTLADVPRYPIETPVAAIRFLAAEQQGIVDYVEPAAALALDGVQKAKFYMPAGSVVECTTSNYTRLGYVIIYAKDAQEANALADEALQRLAVQVAPAVML